MQNTLAEWIRAKNKEEAFCIDEAEAVSISSRILDLPSFDMRTNQELEECAFTHIEARERERAVWELLYRDIPNRFELLRKVMEHEPNGAVRSNLLWLSLKVCASHAPGFIQAALRDDDREVRDWAKLYLSEITGITFQSEYRSGIFVPGRRFDQTLPLQIAGFAVVSAFGRDLRIVLSPLWFSHIQGRVMACTCEQTFMTNLTIEKAYFNYHPDGTTHYEIYPFAGKSWKSSDGRTQHRYLMKALHPTYLSGRVEEDPENKILVPIAGNRTATTVGRTIQIFERLESNHDSPIPTDITPERRSVVSDVRGQYFGWAHASIKHYLSYGDVFPGTVQLVSPVEAATADLVNCYICGTFRGKISDHNGDGLLDVNEIVCHGSQAGRLDYAGDGDFNVDPFE
ncbi:MAG TPA: hypothetical protein VF088_14750 [Pyrinomonadaceae bacterium]